MGLNAYPRKACEMTPEHKGPEKGAEKGIGDSRGGVPEAVRSDLGGPRGAFELAAVAGFLKGKGGRKRVRHSTRLARAGGERPLTH